MQHGALCFHNVLTTMNLMAEKKNQEGALRVRLGESRKGKLDALLERRKISQQDALCAIVDWLVEQPDEVQTLVLGTLPDSLRPVAARMMLDQWLPEEPSHGRQKRRRA